MMKGEMKEKADLTHEYKEQGDRVTMTISSEVSNDIIILSKRAQNLVNKMEKNNTYYV